MGYPGGLHRETAHIWKDEVASGRGLKDGLSREETACSETCKDVACGHGGGGGKVREGVRGQVMMLLRDLLWSLDTGLWANGSSAEH